MLIASLRLTCVLNALGAGDFSAPVAEAELRFNDQPHHVADPDQVLGLDPLAGTPIRLALARVASLLPGAHWALALPRPGRLFGLCGPAGTTAAALDSGALVVNHAGGAAWVGYHVGPALQWRLMAAERPMLPLTPAEQGRTLSEMVAEAARDLADLDSPAGRRPSLKLGPHLGPAYPRGNQALLERALTLHEACQVGLAATAQVLTLHAVQQRERHLRALDDACLDVVASVASWPIAAMH